METRIINREVTIYLLTILPKDDPENILHIVSMNEDQELAKKELLNDAKDLIKAEFGEDIQSLGPSELRDKGFFSKLERITSQTIVKTQSSYVNLA